MSNAQIIVVGAGAFGKNHVRIFSEIGSLLGVVDQNASLLSEIADLYPGACCWETLGDAILDAPKAAIVIATPAPTHFKLAKFALEQGRDVLVEKPFTMSSEEARILIELAQKSSLVLMVGHLLLFQPFLSWFKEEFETGRLGAIKRVSTQRTKLGTVRSSENVWWSFAPHDVSVVLEILGRPKLSSVAAHAACVLQSEVEDDVHVELAFSNGTFAHIHCSWLWPDNVRRTTVICEHKMLIYDEIENSITILNSKINPDLSHQLDPSPEVIRLPKVNLLELEALHFLACVQDRSSPIPDGDNGRMVVDILEKAQKLL